MRAVLSDAYAPEQISGAPMRGFQVDEALEAAQRTPLFGAARPWCGFSQHHHALETIGAGKAHAAAKAGAGQRTHGGRFDQPAAFRAAFNL